MEREMRLESDNDDDGDGSSEVRGNWTTVGIAAIHLGDGKNGETTW